MHRRSLRSLVLAGFAACALTGCNSLSYKTWEALGYHARDLLVENVQKARDSQDQAKDEIKDALEEFRSVVNFDGGELEANYKKLKAAYESSETRAADVKRRIAKVEESSDYLFAEWRKELAEYSNADLRAASEKKLEATEAKSQQLIAKMKQAEAKIPPVLTVFKDQVLYLKHNLNAKVVGALKDELASVETDVNALIADMEASMAEADKFIADLKSDA